MAEEKKGHMKVTIDVEISASLMEMMKECMENMPQLIQTLAKNWRKKEE